LEWCSRVAWRGLFLRHRLVASREWIVRPQRVRHPSTTTTTAVGSCGHQCATRPVHRAASAAAIGRLMRPPMRDTSTDHARDSIETRSGVSSSSSIDHVVRPVDRSSGDGGPSSPAGRQCRALATPAQSRITHATYRVALDHHRTLAVCLLALPRLCSAPVCRRRGLHSLLLLLSPTVQVVVDCEPASMHTRRHSNDTFKCDTSTSVGRIGPRVSSQWYSRVDRRPVGPLPIPRNPPR
jgi:hypothetical protein